MPRRTGQISGQAPAGWGWGDYVAELVEEHGTLTALAWKLVESGEGDDVTSVERALRRLRARGQGEGGVWGTRLLRRFGVPRTLDDRLRWMALYHSPFNELPVAICEDHLRLWDHPPLSEARSRVWLHLAAVNVALRRRDFARASAHLDRGDGTEYPDARIEIELARSYVASRVGTREEAHAHVARAESLLSTSSLREEDRACFAARVVGSSAFDLHRRGEHEAALARFRTLPSDDVHPFASYRRDAGLAYACAKTGARDEARAYARRAFEHAGDGGYARLRVMALLMLVRIDNDRDALARAERIARWLGDDELLERVKRAAARLA